MLFKLETVWLHRSNGKLNMNELMSLHIGVGFPRTENLPVSCQCTELHGKNALYTNICTVQYLHRVQCSPVKISEFVGVGGVVMLCCRHALLRTVEKGDLAKLVLPQRSSKALSETKHAQFLSWGNLPKCGTSSLMIKFVSFSMVTDMIILGSGAVKALALPQMRSPYTLSKKQFKR